MFSSSKNRKNSLNSDAAAAQIGHLDHNYNARIVHYTPKVNFA